jgi:hypothetical protein
MKAAQLKMIGMALCIFAATASFAQEMNVGSWKLNEEKSKIPAGVAKNTSVVYEKDGDNLKAVLDGVDGAGKPNHSEWTGKFDGKDYPVTGDPRFDMRAITKVDERHLKISNKKNGKVEGTGEVETSADGKSRTLISHFKDKKGKKISATFVYDKQ